MQTRTCATMASLGSPHSSCSRGCTTSSSQTGSRTSVTRSELEAARARCPTLVDVLSDLKRRAPAGWALTVFYINEDSDARHMIDRRQHGSTRMSFLSDHSSPLPLPARSIPPVGGASTIFRKNAGDDQVNLTETATTTILCKVHISCSS